MSPQPACGHAICDPFQACLFTGHTHAPRRPAGTCDQAARKGTGTGACGRPLDDAGACDRPGDHIDL